MVVEINGVKNSALTPVINDLVKSFFPRGNRVMISFWTNDLQYIRIYPNQEFYDYIITSKMFQSSTLHHIRRINFNCNLLPNEFWNTDELINNYNRLKSALNVLLPTTYVRVFNEGKLIFQFVKYCNEIPVSLIQSQEINLIADTMDAISPLLSEHLSVLQETQFSINQNYRRDIITNKNLNKLILTNIEKKTIYWLSVGKTLEDIALMYDNKISTVKSRMKVIRDKLCASTNIQVIAIALKYKLV